MNGPPRLRTGWVAISRPSTFVEDSGHAAQNFQIGLPQTDGQEPRSARRTKASLCQEALPVFFPELEVALGRCGLAGGRGLLSFPAAECGRCLAAPPGRSSSLRCGRSTWRCGVAGGGVAATGERPALSRLLAAVLGWWPGPGVACPKSRCLGCEPAALESESFPGCPPGPWARRAS